MILSEAGYTVTAVDYTEEMLEKAKENLGKYTKYGLERVTLQRMDAQNLEFADETFDVVISRNLTWNLEKPEQAYQEWMRVLKPGGVLLNFDANWYGYLYDEEKKEAYESDRKKVEEQQGGILSGLVPGDQKERWSWQGYGDNGGEIVKIKEHWYYYKCWF